MFVFNFDELDIISTNIQVTKIMKIKSSISKTLFYFMALHIMVP